MVQLTKIYTRGGDGGKTSTGTGKRLLKSDILIEAIGAIDEANAAVGCAFTMLHHPGLKEDLVRIQHDLFDCGADLCVENYEEGRLRILPKQVAWLEKRIDFYNGSLTPLTSFVLPGGTGGASFLHLARTIVRRAERALVKLTEEKSEQINKQLVVYINRLSDYLFVAARCENKGHDVLWEPGKSQKE